MIFSAQTDDICSPGEVEGEAGEDEGELEEGEVRQGTARLAIHCTLLQAARHTLHTVQCTLDRFAKTHFVDSDLPIQSLSSLG